MDVFDWRAKKTNDAVILGLSVAACWATQHPLQGPLYKFLGRSFDGTLETMMYAQFLVIPLYLLLFLASSVRAGLSEIARERSWKFLFPPPILGTIGLALYALGQTKVDGTQISIILAASPVGVVAYIYVDNKYRLHPAIHDAVHSRLLHIHLALIIGVGALAWLGGSQATHPINWAYALLVLLVPGFYFGSFSYTYRHFRSSNQMYLAAIAMTALGGSLTVGLTLLAYLSLKGHQFGLLEASSDLITLFAVGGIVASFGGTILYNINVLQAEWLRKRATIALHATPFFSVIIALLCSMFFVELISLPNYYQFLSAIFVFIALYMHDRLKKEGETH